MLRRMRAFIVPNVMAKLNISPTYVGGLHPRTFIAFLQSAGAAHAGSILYPAQLKCRLLKVVPRQSEIAPAPARASIHLVSLRDRVPQF